MMAKAQTRGPSARPSGGYTPMPRSPETPQSWERVSSGERTTMERAIALLTPEEREQIMRRAKERALYSGWRLRHNSRYVRE